MIFSYTRRNLSPGLWRLERFLEILPAALSWGLIFSLFFLCLFSPIAGVIAIVLFDLYWLFRLLYFTIFLVLSYGLLEIERSAPWRRRLEDLLNLDCAIGETKKRIREAKMDFKTRFSEKRHLAKLKQIKQKSLRFPQPKELVHLVLIPFYSEGISVLQSTLEALANADYPLEQIMVVLGVEERAGRSARELAERLKKEFGKHFFHFEICVHPEDLPDEAAVKGANATYAAKWAKKFFEDRGIALENVVVSCFDSDTVASPEYFSCLTYNYLTHPERTRTSFQPIPIYHNNLWDAPSFAQVLETGSSFMQLIEVTNPETLVTFSSHSMSFKALDEIGYWPVDLVSDDSAIFWKAFLFYDGDYRVEPLYVTLSMDVALEDNFWETCQSIYRQKKRWAWGIENFPIFVRGLIANPKIPLKLKIKQAFRLLEMNVSWAAWTPIMLILSWTPALIVTREFESSVAHFNAPRVAGVIFDLAMASLVISIILSLLLLPKRPKPVPLFEKLLFALQWLLLPLTATLFGSVPALDAQTRLALGRYMEFFVAPKGKRKVAPKTTS